MRHNKNNRRIRWIRSNIGDALNGWMGKDSVFLSSDATRNDCIFVTPVKTGIKLRRILLLFVMMFAVTGSIWATHNRAGEITYEHVGGLTYRVRMVIYTKTSANIERNYLKIRWGDEPSNVTDSQLDSLIRVNNGGNGQELPGYTDVKKNEYVGLHTYPGPGTYVLQMEDPNRNEGVLNIATGPGGASVSIMAYFALQSVLIIRPGNLGSNNSVRLTGVPIQNACLNQPWIHNPIAIDPDGDELRYSLVPCRGQGGVPLDAWMSPEVYTQDPNDTFVIDPITGDITWTTPLEVGEYNIAILIEEYRQGYLMGSVIRDMQIKTEMCANIPPVIQPIADRCVVANGSLSFSVTATDSGPGAGLQSLEALGAPMTAVLNVADFSQVLITGNTASGTFTWNPKCTEVRLQPYQVSFKTTDTGVPGSGAYALSTFETVRIRVVAPRVEQPQAQAIGNQIHLSWNTTVCQPFFTAEEAAQVKYYIYKRNGLYGFVPDECELGVPEYTGYHYIGQTTGVNATSFIDTDVTYGGVYCYMVVVVWPDGSESYASEEFCDTIRKEVPVMTRVSIHLTDLTSGADTIQWSKPSELDATVFTGPYRYRLYHAEAFNTPETLVFESDVFLSLADGDTVYVHQGLNTSERAQSYRVELYSESLNQGVGFSSQASSPFLSLLPGDNKMELSVTHQVPWDNYAYRIYRKAPNETDYSFITTVATAHYVDSNLVNNQSYCYKVEVWGHYQASDVSPVLINWSQEACATPYDNEPPCAPTLSVDADCMILQNQLHWNNPGLTCGESDVTGYRIYYSPIEGGEMKYIAALVGSDQTSFEYIGEVEPFSIAGCYAVTAVDSLSLWPDGQMHQNESALSNIVCVDNCPAYELPNIFTPNGDGVNDRLIPRLNRYIQDVELNVYNRWGNVVFTTTDPKINWNGIQQDSGEMCSDGVYYYVIRVNTIRLQGIVPEILKGYVRLADGSKPAQN